MGHGALHLWLRSRRSYSGNYTDSDERDRERSLPGLHTTRAARVRFLLLWMQGVGLMDHCPKLAHLVDPSLTRNGLFLSDLPCTHWIEYVKELEAKVAAFEEEFPKADYERYLPNCRDVTDDPCGRCGHQYYRHFDSWEPDLPEVGCKYCSCHKFQEKGKGV